MFRLQHPVLLVHLIFYSCSFDFTQGRNSVSHFRENRFADINVPTQSI